MNEIIHLINSVFGNEGNFALDDDVFDKVVNCLTAKTSRQQHFEGSRRACQITRGLLSRSEILLPRQTHTLDAGNGENFGLRCIQVQDEESRLWDLTLLAQCLQQLFPRASCSNAVPPETWPAPSLHSAFSSDSRYSGIRRAAYLAKIKVMWQRQNEEGQKLLTEKLSQLQHSKDLRSLQQGLLSVHGIIRTGRTDSLSERNLVCVEACKGHILMRPMVILANNNTVLNEDTVHGRNSLTIVGMFYDKDIQLIKDIFKWCKSHKMNKRKKVNRSDLSDEFISKLQIGFETAPLPSGWWYDGNGYIDIHGTKTILRPDIEDLIINYIALKNEDLEKINNILEEVSEFLN